MGMITQRQIQATLYEIEIYISCVVCVCVKYSELAIFRGQLSPKYPRQTHHSLLVRTRYGCFCE